jgi:beta-lactamase class A
MGRLGVAVLDLGSGQEFLLHGDEVFPQASSIKIAVLAELYHQAEQSERGTAGTSKLTDRYVVRAEDIVPGSDIMGGLTPGVTQLTNGDLATREMMTLLERLYHGKVIGPPLLEDFFTILATNKDSWLPRTLPEGLRIANKPGALEGVRNDSGIVFLKNRPYVVCVMTTYLAS